MLLLLFIPPSPRRPRLDRTFRILLPCYSNLSNRSGYRRTHRAARIEVILPQRYRSNTTLTFLERTRTMGLNPALCGNSPPRFLNSSRPENSLSFGTRNLARCAWTRYSAATRWLVRNTRWILRIVSVFVNNALDSRRTAPNAPTFASSIERLTRRRRVLPI